MENSVCFDSIYPLPGEYRHPGFEQILRLLRSRLCEFAYVTQSAESSLSCVFLVAIAQTCKIRFSSSFFFSLFRDNMWRSRWHWTWHKTSRWFWCKIQLRQGIYNAREQHFDVFKGWTVGQQKTKLHLCENEWESLRKMCKGLWSQQKHLSRKQEMSLWWRLWI